MHQSGGIQLQTALRPGWEAMAWHWRCAATPASILVRRVSEASKNVARISAGDLGFSPSPLSSFASLRHSLAVTTELNGWATRRSSNQGAGRGHEGRGSEE